MNEIYQDDKGKMVDVQKMYIKKRHGFLYWFFMTILFGALCGGGALIPMPAGAAQVCTLDGTCEPVSGDSLKVTANPILVRFSG